MDYDFILSPFSVWSLLVLVAEGAAGNTLTEFQNVLGLPPQLDYIRAAYSDIQKALVVNTTTVELSVNQLLITDTNRPIESDYQYRLDHVYNADHLALNFADVVSTFDLINGHVRDATHGKIRQVVNYEDLRLAQMMLISAIYFKGQWTVCNLPQKRTIFFQFSYESFFLRLTDSVQS